VRKTIFIIFLSISLSRAQSSDNYFETGLELERTFRVTEALEAFESEIKLNPNHTEALTHASRMLSIVAGRLPASEVSEKERLLNKAKSYADKSIEINPNQSQSILAKIIALGMLSEIAASASEKVKDAQIIHQEATKILKIDSSFAEAYFVLGKWQLELSSLNWMELMACKIFYGGFPEEISLHRAEEYFLKALSYNGESILFLYGLASSQYKMGEKKKAIDTIKKALSLPLKEPDDLLRKERCQSLLNKINSK
jgi:tetratricopeptide (TPR) repeat protein